MPKLTPGKPVTVRTPELLVENELPAGRYRFQLVVTDTAGLESAPALLTVTVRAPTRPVRPVVRELDERLVRPVRPAVPRPEALRTIRRPPR